MSREPRPRAESREPRAESPRAESREPRAESREPESREPRAEPSRAKPSQAEPSRAKPSQASNSNECLHRGKSKQKRRVLYSVDQILRRELRSLYKKHFKNKTILM